jgi:hypothetical protein
MMDADRRGSNTSPRAMPEGGIGCISYLADLILNLETGVWINNCPQLMPRSETLE